MTRATTLPGGLALTASPAGVVVLDVAAFGDGELEFSVFDAPVALGALSLAVGHAAGEPWGAEGGFKVRSGGAALLDGELAAPASSGGGTLELAFGDLGGPAAGSFGTTALVTFDFGGALGADPLGAFAEDASLDAAISLGAAPGAAPAPIPLPAAGALTLAAATGLVALRRRG